MIFGIGTDIVKIKRIENLLKKDNFLGRFFTQKEIEGFKERNYSAESIAGCFCAKEAFSKALGTGVNGFNLTDIEVLHNEFGKPYLKLYNKALQYSKAQGIEFFVSISHEKEFATAMVVAQLIEE